MVKRAKRCFNTSGPNIPEKHYTLPREQLIEKGIQLVRDDRYFTIWAPRQTGKSTYFLMLAEKLEKLGFQVLKTNLENFKDASEETLLRFLTNEFRRAVDLHLEPNSFPLFHDQMMDVRDRKLVLIIDEIEGLNKDIFGQFLHTIRNLYHFRQVHALKSVILVGVSNIVGAPLEK